MEAGKKLLQQNDASRAILEFRNAAQATPRSAEVYYQLGLAYLQAKDLAKGIASLRRAIELDPKHTAAQLQLAQVLTGADDPSVLKDARQRLEDVLKGRPNNSDALHALALTELKLGDTDAAAQHLERALLAAPQDLAFAVTLAETKMRQKDPGGAEKVLREACDRSPKSADAAVLLGRFYALQKRIPEAEQQFQRALALDGNHTAALLNMGTLQYELGKKQQAGQLFKQLSNSSDKAVKPAYALFLFQEGRQDEAIAEFARLANQDPSDSSARTRLIAAYQSAGRVHDAEKLLSDVLKKNPKDLEALLQRGELAIAAGKYSDAEADLNNVLRLKPDSPEVHYAFAKLHEARGATQRHRQELSEALRLNRSLLPVRIELAKSMMADKAPKAALEVLSATPDDQKRTISYIEQHNWALLSTNQLNEAQSGIQQGLMMARTPDLLLQDALLKSGGKKYAEAQQVLHEALTKSPEDIRLLRVLVQIYAAQKQIPNAVRDVRAHADKYNQSAKIWYFLGNLLTETGDRSQAQAAFAKAKALDPKDINADLALAQIELKQANWDTARGKLGTVLNSRKENPTARLWLGMLEEVNGNHTAAIEHFRKVVDVDPSNILALNNLAFLLAEYANRADEALKYAQKAKELAPDNPDIEDTLGWVLYRKGLYSVAVKYLESAASKDGPSKQAVARRRYHLAMAYGKVGQEKRGRATFESAQRLDPNLPEATLARQSFQGSPQGR